MDAKHKVSLEVDLSEGTASLVAVVTTALTLVTILLSFKAQLTTGWSKLNCITQQIQ